MLFKDSLIYISGGPFVQFTRMIYAFLVEGIMWNLSVELLVNFDQWLRRCNLKIYLIYSSSGPYST